MTESELFAAMMDLIKDTGRDSDMQYILVVLMVAVKTGHVQLLRRTLELFVEYEAEWIKSIHAGSLQ